MKFSYLVTVGAVALIASPVAARAQQMDMPGMAMPMPVKKAPAEKKPSAKKTSARKRAGSKESSRNSAAPVSDASKAGQSSTRSTTMPADHMPAQSPMSNQGAMPMVHPSQPQRGGMTMPMGEHSGHEMPMTGVLGSYPMERESSGTAWQPDDSPHMGAMTMSGAWMLMAHGDVNLVFDHQSGARGGDKGFVSGMLMGMARRPLGNGTLQFRASLSPDPLMGASGYPLLLASGETANGRDRLIDRQHPHDLFMELSASASQNIGANSSVFLYAGLPGEPAFGPPAFMHREAIMDSPEAPISHHWLDSTHISFGVVTTGVVVDRVKLEVSRFNGREPDQNRWNIETGPLDSTAIRLSWNPTRELALQGSWGHFVDPEQLEPGVNQKRWSASLLYAHDLAPGWRLAGTLAWGRKTAGQHTDDAYVAEASLKHGYWTLFGRAEMTENRELLPIDDGPAYRVGKVSLGAVRDFRLTKSVLLGTGGLMALNFVPDGLAPLYGASHPICAMAFLRLKLQ